jgi:RNA polymerase sigma factor (sigma-70 family)
LSVARGKGARGKLAPAGKRRSRGRASEAARKRVAIEMIAQHEATLRHTARRYSLCEDDAEDAYQRALEILLTKAPTDDLRELIRWTQTVVKHEALTVRRNRERQLGGPSPGIARMEPDWVAMPAEDSDPAEHFERREIVARSREALRSLKPQELRALSLLAEGYSYAEIGQITGYSRTKINRCLAEGRDRFRHMLDSSSDGNRCREMGPLLSAFCDGETTEKEEISVREHLRACGHCRSTMRAYRAAPGAAAALAPLLPARSLLDRVHEAFAGLYSRLPGQGGGTTDSALSQIAAAGGSRGTGMAALAKVLALCVGTAGGAAACVATGVAPAPIEIGPDHAKRPTLERPAGRVIDSFADTGVTYEPAPVEPNSPGPASAPKHVSAPPVDPAQPPSSSSPAGAVEYTPEAAAPPAESPVSSESSSNGSAAGEFGP